MQFRPLHDRVVVRRIEQEEKTKGGIISPDTAKEKPQEGEILAVGPGDLWLIGIFGGIAVLVVIAFYKELLVVSFDPILAATLRLPAADTAADIAAGDGAVGRLLKGGFLGP